MIWNLEPGAERPVIRPRGALVPKAGVGNLTPSEIADRCEHWYGARVVLDGAKYKIYPPDPAQRMVSMPDRLGNGTERSNILSTLRKAGLDVVNEPEKIKPERTPDPMPTPADLARTNGSVPRSKLLADSAGNVDTLLEMLGEADRRIAALERRDEARIEQLAGLQNAVVGLQGDLATLRRQLAALRASKGDPKVDPNVARDEKILDYLHRRAGDKHLTQTIAMNIDEDARIVGKRLQALAGRDRVRSEESTGGRWRGKIYWVEAE